MLSPDYAQRFYARLAPIYDWAIFGRVLDGGRREAARLVEPGERVLEVGVGTGLGLRHYPCGCEVVGVDLCRAMLRRARWRALMEGNGTRIRLRWGDASRLPDPDGAYDTVIAPYVVTTVTDPDALCAEMARVCRPGGRVIVVSNTREAGVYGTIKGAASPLFQRFGFRTDLDVRAALERAGMRVRWERRVNRPPVHKLFLADKPGPDASLAAVALPCAGCGDSEPHR